MTKFFTISQRIRKARKESGLSIEKMARQIGVSGRTLSRWEIGGGEPEISAMKDMAQATNVFTSWLLTGEGPMRPGDADPNVVTGTAKAYLHVDEAVIGHPSPNPTRNPMKDFMLSVFFDDLRGLCEKAKDMTPEELAQMAQAIRRLKEGK